MFDLEKSFSDLVDDCFPNYAASSQAGFAGVLNKYFESLADDKTIAIYGVGRLAKSIFSILGDKAKSRIKYYSDVNAENKDLIFENKTVLSPRQLLAKNPDIVILCSIEHQLSMKKTLTSVGFSREKLIELELSLDQSWLKNFYGYERTAVGRIGYASLEYCSDDEISADVLKELVYAYIEIRDILNAQKYANLYVQRGYREHECFERFLLKSGRLLEEVKAIAQNRKASLFVIYLFDGLSESLIEFAPHIKKKKTESLVFDRAFTQYGFTTASLQCMFTGKDLIDEGACEIAPFTSENSILLRTIKECGYTFKPIIAFDKQLFCLSECEPSYRLTISSQLWRLLCEVCSADEKQAFFIHMMETHPPYHNGFTDSTILLNQNDFDGSLKTELMNLRKLEVAKASRYAGEQWHFYDSFLPLDAIRVSMSDHGNFFNNFIDEKSKHFCGFDKVSHNTRITLFAASDNIKPRVINEMFSMKDFYKLFLCLIGNTTVDSITSEYCKLQMLPFYDIDLLERKTPNLPLPKCGIITKNGIYIRNYHGEESFYPNKLENHISNKEYASVIAQCRELCTTDLHGIFEMEKFATAKQYYMRAGLLRSNK